MSQRSPRPIPRRGFTLIELLIVIAIMGLLASMALVTYGRVGENARIAGTKTLIKQLDSSLRERLEAHRRYDFGPLAQSFFKYSGTQQQYEPVAWLKKLTYRGEFPQRFEDLYGFDGDSGDGHNFAGGMPSQSLAKTRDNSPLWTLVKLRTGGTVGMLNSTGTPSSDLATRDASNPSDPYISNSELLYLFLTEASSYGLPPLDLSQIDPKYIVDTDNDSFPEFLDGWGQPLRFYSAPTGLLRPNGNVYDDIPMGMSPAPSGQNITPSDYQNARYLIRSLPPFQASTSSTDVLWNDYTSPLNIDPHDYLGIIQLDRDPSDATLTAENTFEQAFHAINTYWVPLLVSGGSDQLLGMYEPALVTPEGTTQTGGTNNRNRLGVISNVADVYDNLTNYQRGGF